MFRQSERHSISFSIDSDPGADAEMFYLMRAPYALTVEAFNVVAEQSSNAGTAIGAILEKWTAGTAVGGTICVQVGGTAVASRLTARTPSAGSVNRANNYVNAGDYLVVNYKEEGTGWISADRLCVTVDYVIGKGNTTSIS